MVDTNKSSTSGAFEEPHVVDLNPSEQLEEDDFGATQAMDAVSAQAKYIPSDTMDELSAFEDDGMAPLPVSSAQAEAMLAQIEAQRLEVEAAQRAAAQNESEELGMAATAMLDQSTIEAIERKAAEARRSTQIEPPEKVAELLSEAQKLAKRSVPATLAERAIPKTQNVNFAGHAPAQLAPPPAKRPPTLLYLAIAFVVLLILGGIAFVVIVALS
ncbi:MAG: hypothetical protein AUK47_14880 [Deltaproteobacteria bacterium CG2_30_63_29]|nr:MAG: hypothetical protein AUK47_14880 [Deltaproteobacteria bacterium CG2_30_63_29]PJB42109.1 MAG: hypothetical protein CO108_12220 [Deltaproteobacteria bacterium CG_4_9_14_3_um_filter_63_12]